MEYSRSKYIERLIARRENGLIKIITGSRRSGKSYLLNELYYKYLVNQGILTANIIRFAFDADEDIDLLDSYYPEEPTRIRQKDNKTVLVNAKKFRAYIADKTAIEGKYYLLLDEVQLLENFVGTLNGFLRHRNLDVYVTGSNSRFLSSDIATEFKGRGTIIHVLPLVFSEYAEGAVQNTAELWREYIETGGIPLVAQMKTREEKISYLKLLCEETYLKDIVEHNNVRKSEELSETFDLLASMIGSPVSSLKIANTFQTVTKKSITDDTIAKYIGFFEDAFLVSKARKYNIRGRKYIGSPYKLYFEDIGVRNARLNFRQIEETHIMENIIYNELRYRGFHVDVGELTIREKTERKDSSGRSAYEQKALEVDFIAEAGSQRYYIQSALSMSDTQKENQEKKSLRNIDDSFQKIVITRNGLNMLRDDRGIITMDLFDFLMNQNAVSAEN